MSYIFNEKELIEAEQEEALIIASNERQKELDELNSREYAILLSVKPQWVEKILKDEKTIEIRKSMPKCELPVKVYIYCTKGQPLYGDGSGETWHSIAEDEDVELVYKLNPTFARLNGKVVAEFTFNKVTEHSKNYISVEEELSYNFLSNDVKKIGFNDDINGLLDFDRFIEDYGQGKTLYAWHIEDLKIYDKPKELSDFEYPDKPICYEDNKNVVYGYLTSRKLIKAPQSWCYVRSLNE